MGISRATKPLEIRRHQEQRLTHLFVAVTRDMKVRKVTCISTEDALRQLVLPCKRKGKNFFLLLATFGWVFLLPPAVCVYIRTQLFQRFSWATEGEEHGRESLSLSVVSKPGSEASIKLGSESHNCMCIYACVWCTWKCLLVYNSVLETVSQRKHFDPCVGRGGCFE